jgi:sterol desaturase/sphingolipid hydroxylase (fatty acid hydroxylase superfamily)
MTVMNTAVAFVALYVVYDLFYTLFHRFLHHRSVYWLVHKHHHRQHAPTR